MKIIPTIFAHNKKKFQERFEKLLPITNNLQIDFMDGKFVPEKSPTLEEIPNLIHYKKNFEAHLMVSNPSSLIPRMVEKGFKKIVIHYESFKDFNDIFPIINNLKKNQIKIFLALNPETPVEKSVPFLAKLSGVLLMGVHPGKEHQKFIPQVYKKIAQLKKFSPQTRIQIDGGANESVIKRLAALNIDYINVGSYVADSDKPKTALAKLKQLGR
jgi:ribulose-phosphate 3-epimerase